jgi:hypothetical protein
LEDEGDVRPQAMVVPAVQRLLHSRGDRIGGETARLGLRP